MFNHFASSPKGTRGALFGQASPRSNSQLYWDKLDNKLPLFKQRPTSIWCPHPTVTPVSTPITTSIQCSLPPPLLLCGHTHTHSLLGVLCGAQYLIIIFGQTLGTKDANPFASLVAGLHIVLGTPQKILSRVVNSGATCTRVCGWLRASALNMVHT